MREGRGSGRQQSQRASNPCAWSLGSGMALCRKSPDRPLPGLTGRLVCQACLRMKQMGLLWEGQSLKQGKFGIKAQGTGCGQ